MSTNGIGSCLLGFNDEDVTRVVMRRLRLGSMSSLNPPEEVELAELLLNIHPWAEQARFTRGGGEACTVAVRTARATTSRSIIAVCGYRGWQDWYLAVNLGDENTLSGHLLPGLEPSGVPRQLSGTTLTFTMNNRDELQKIIDCHGQDLAAVIMEPCRYRNPEPGFLEYVREQYRRSGALLIFDEITIGWRLHYGGSHLTLNVLPDLAVFAKALGNGHPIGAVIGTKAAMEGAHRSFISSTYWTEGVGPVAAVAALKKMRELPIQSHVEKIGRTIAGIWNTCGSKHKLPVMIEEGFGCLAHFKFSHPEADALRTLYTVKMLERGFLASNSIYPTYAHDDQVAEAYGNAIDEVFGEIAINLEAGSVSDAIGGKIAHSGFRRLN